MEGASQETLGLLRCSIGSQSSSAPPPPQRPSCLGLFGSELTNMPATAVSGS